MKHSYALLPLLLAAFSLAAQPTASSVARRGVVWQAAAPQPAEAARHSRTVAVEAAALAATLLAAPAEAGAAEAGAAHGVLLPVPLPDGGTETFRVWQTPVLAPALAARYPGIRTYAGQSLRNPSVSGRFDLTPQGFHAYVLGEPGGAFFVEPLPAAPGTYAVFDAAARQPTSPWHCLAPEPFPGPRPAVAARTQAAAFGSQLLTYRLALACTGEYAAAVTTSRGLPLTKANVLAAMATAINRVTGIYERELAIRLQLIAATDAVIFLDATTDPYTNTNGSTMLTENRNTLRDLIGFDAYDIGHVFSTGGGGVAGLGVVCRTLTGSADNRNLKARGVTGLPNPVGDAFYVDYVAHEMGHQFGGNHTFNSVTGACGGGNRNAATAIEPGSGTTIMAYAGICGADNTQSNSDPYFHAVSQDEIRTYVTGSNGGACPVPLSTGNAAPAVTAGADYFAPRGTPFVLTGSATDANNDPLVYSWEQINPDNTATGGPPAAAATSTTAPLFRSFAPAGSPARTFPRLTDILANTTTPGEILPQVARTLQFRLTARDNRTGVASDDMQLTVLNVSPFLITNANVAFSQAPNSSFSLTWDHTGTTAAPISAATVDVLFSADGGQTFPYLLAAGVPNDGEQSIVFPNLTTTTGRLRVQAPGHIFFDINNANITLAGPLPVSLTRFEADAHDTDIVLRWHTAQEQHNAGFAVQAQGPDDAGFRTVAFVPGHGTTAQPQAYRHTLPGRAPGRWHLRLQQLDTTGPTAAAGPYSPVRTVQVAPEPAAVQIWPNPAPAAGAKAGVYVPAAGPARLVVHDLLGRPVLELALQLAAGRTDVPLPLAGLPGGLYAWQLITGSRQLQGQLQLRAE